jgi:hypothetical protein
MVKIKQTKKDHKSYKGRTGDAKKTVNDRSRYYNHEREFRPAGEVRDSAAYFDEDESVMVSYEEAWDSRQFSERGGKQGLVQARKAKVYQELSGKRTALSRGEAKEHKSDMELAEAKYNYKAMNTRAKLEKLKTQCVVVPEGPTPLEAGEARIRDGMILYNTDAVVRHMKVPGMKPLAGTPNPEGNRAYRKAAARGEVIPTYKPLRPYTLPLSISFKNKEGSEELREIFADWDDIDYPRDGWTNLPPGKVSKVKLPNSDDAVRVTWKGNPLFMDKVKRSFRANWSLASLSK